MIDTKTDDKSCSGKKPFDSKREAEQRLLEIRHEENQKPKKERNTTIPIRAYRCDTCHKWHLTSVSNKDFKKIKARKRKYERWNSDFNLEVQYWKKKLGVD